MINQITQEYLEKGHLKIKIIDIKLFAKFLKIFTIFFTLFLSGCDFRLPQKWETPSWEFDLLIPLINENYNMASIASDSNDIQIVQPDSSNFIIELKETVIDSGYVKTDESFFIIPSNDLEFDFTNISVTNPNPMPTFPSITEEILLSDLIDDPNLIQDGQCFPSDLNFLDNDLENLIEDTNDGFCNEIGQIQCLDELNWLTIGQGNNTFTINNEFPFIIDEFRLQIMSNGEELINNYLTQIDGQEIEITNLFNKNLGCDVSSSVYLRIDEDLTLSNNYNSCDLYNENTCTELGYLWQDDDCFFSINIDQNICQELGYSWENNQCIQIIPNIYDEFSCNLIPGDTQWNGTLCYIVIEMNQTFCNDIINGSWINNECYVACTSNEICCDSINGNWNGNECLDLPTGVWITGNEKITISNELEIDNFESLNADLNCLIDTSYSVALPVDDNMQLVQGIISNISDIDTNRISFDLVNDFFTDINFNLYSSNLFDSENQSLSSTQTIVQGQSFEDILLSNYTIKNLDGTSVDSLTIGYSVMLDEDNAELNFDQPYGLTGNGIETKTIQLDELRVNLNEFSTSDIDLGNLPSGFEGFDLPYLKFNLYLYNQISADMKLYLDLFGISDDDTLKIHVEPNIKFLNELDPYSDIDTLKIAFIQDTMSTVHFGNNPIFHDDPVIEIMDNRITELFSYDIIDISGYAVMDGDATLLPEKSLWGEIEIEIQPLTIVIEDGDVFSFVPDDFTSLNAMDRQTATKIDSGLVSATLNMNVNNKIPFGGNLLMYITNSPDFFPMCIDSLISGNLNEQNVDSTCKADLQNYLLCENLQVEYDSTNTFVSHMDCLSSDYNYYFENLLNLNFNSPNLDSIGIVLDSILTHQTIILDDQINYFTRDSSQYLIPRFVFDSELDTITFQPKNTLSVNSHLIFKLLSSGLLEE
tara:strand:+ start:8108 stop:10900 length:2793 start_codon:yes stop_codon:yes gene_type:complete